MQFEYYDLFHLYTLIQIVKLYNTLSLYNYHYYMFNLDLLKEHNK